MPEQQPLERRLSCRDFLERHGEYLDRVIPAGEMHAFDVHARACRSCGNYDRVMRRGLLLARNLPELQPSTHFHEKLQARLMRLEDEPITQPVVANTATVVVIAAVLTLIAVTPLFRMASDDVPVVATSPAFSPLDAPADLPLRGTAAVLVNGADVFNFSPVIVQPPAVQLSPSAPRLVAYPLLQTDER